jgi:hypothetical protein
MKRLILSSMFMKHSIHHRLKLGLELHLDENRRASLALAAGSKKPATMVCGGLYVWLRGPDTCFSEIEGCSTALNIDRFKSGTRNRLDLLLIG